jgi:hypothetical protein
VRGTFVFPGDDTDFLQLIELRANNGATADVETVFVLTSGDSYAVPTRLFAFDDPGLYTEATPRAVEIDNEAVARTIAAFYDDRDGPKLVSRFHTHPNGGTTPSAKDRRNGPDCARIFGRHFDDAGFFLGIHALREACRPEPDWLRCPARTAADEVAWWGENRKHALALFDGAYEPRPVAVR